jgi:hypothetical protein
MDFGAIGGTVYVLFFFVIAWAVCELNLLFLKVAIEVKSSNFSKRPSVAFCPHDLNFLLYF